MQNFLFCFQGTFPKDWACKGVLIKLKGFGGGVLEGGGVVCFCFALFCVRAFVCLVLLFVGWGGGGGGEVSLFCFWGLIGCLCCRSHYFATIVKCSLCVCVCVCVCVCLCVCVNSLPRRTLRPSVHDAMHVREWRSL